MNIENILKMNGVDRKVKERTEVEKTKALGIGPRSKQRVALACSDLF